MTDQLDVVLGSIESKLGLILEKLNQNQSSIGSRSSISVDDDLIDRLKLTLRDLDLTFPIDKVVNLDDLKNRISFFYKQSSKITNPRAYLNKVLDQVELMGDTIPTPEPVIKKDEISAEEAERLIHVFDGLSDDQLLQIRQSSETYYYLAWGFPREKYRAFHKIAYAAQAERMGLTS